MEKLPTFGLVLLLVGMPGCRNAESGPDSYSVEAKPTGPVTGYVEGRPIPLVAGEVNKIDLRVRFQRSPGRAVKLKYKVQLSAPADLKATTIDGATSWDLEEDLAAGDRGQSLSRTILVKVGADAAGDREIIVTIIPEAGPQVPLSVKCRVGG